MQGTAFFTLPGFRNLGGVSRELWSPISLALLANNKSTYFEESDRNAGYLCPCDPGHVLTATVQRDTWINYLSRITIGTTIRVNYSLYGKHSNKGTTHAHLLFYAKPSNRLSNMNDNILMSDNSNVSLIGILILSATRARGTVFKDKYQAAVVQC